MCKFTAVIEKQWEVWRAYSVRPANTPACFRESSPSFYEGFPVKLKFKKRKNQERCLWKSVKVPPYG